MYADCEGCGYGFVVVAVVPVLVKIILDKLETPQHVQNEGGRCLDALCYNEPRVLRTPLLSSIHSFTEHADSLYSSLHITWCCIVLQLPAAFDLDDGRKF